MLGSFGAKVSIVGILYIEDDGEMIELVRLALSAERDFVSISDWEDLMCYLSQTSVPPRTILLDYYLDGYTAENVLTQLQGYPKFDATEIVLLSSSEAAMTNLKRKYPYRINVCLSKPFSIQNLREVAHCTLV